MTNGDELELSNVSTYLDDGRLTHTGWCAALADGVLLGQRCDECDSVTAAPKAACVNCGTHSTTVEALPTTGEVYAETTIAVAPAGYADGYTVALVTVGDASLMARLDDAVDIGDAVELVGTVEEDTYPAPLFRGK